MTTCRLARLGVTADHATPGPSAQPVRSAQRPRRGCPDLGLGRRGDPQRRDLGRPSRRPGHGSRDRRDRRPHVAPGRRSAPRAGTGDPAGSPRVAPRVERQPPRGCRRVHARHACHEPGRLRAYRVPGTSGARRGAPGRPPARQPAGRRWFRRLSAGSRAPGCRARPAGEGVDRPRARRLRRDASTPRDSVAYSSGSDQEPWLATSLLLVEARLLIATGQPDAATRLLAGASEVGSPSRRLWLAVGPRDDRQGRGAAGVRGTATGAGSPDTRCRCGRASRRRSWRPPPGAASATSGAPRPS